MCSATSRRVLGAEEVGVLVLQHVRTRGLRDDDVVAEPHAFREHRHVAPGVLLELLDVAGVEPGHPAAHLALGEVGSRSRCARTRRPAPGRSRGPGTRRGTSGTASPSPRGSGPPDAALSCIRNHFEKRTLANVGSSRSFAMPGGLLHDRRARSRRCSSGSRRGASVGRDLALQVGTGEELRAARRPCPRACSIASDRSIKRGKSITHSCSLLGRVRADDVAELALVALVDDHFVLLVGEDGDVRPRLPFSSIILKRSLKLGQNRTQMRQSRADLECAVAFGRARRRRSKYVGSSGSYRCGAARVTAFRVRGPGDAPGPLA